MQKKANSIQVSPSEVYAGGTLTPISVLDLKDNVVAINQLLNNHNILQQELNAERLKNDQIEKELTISKISPLVAVLSAVVNIIGTVLIAVSTSIDRDDVAWLFWLLLISGIVCLFCANVATIFYTSISKWLVG